MGDIPNKTSRFQVHMTRIQHCKEAMTLDILHVLALRNVPVALNRGH